MQRTKPSNQSLVMLQELWTSNVLRVNAKLRIYRKYPPTHSFREWMLPESCKNQAGTRDVPKQNSSDYIFPEYSPMKKSSYKSAAHAYDDDDKGYFLVCEKNEARSTTQNSHPWIANGHRKRSILVSLTSHNRFFFFVWTYMNTSRYKDWRFHVSCINHSDLFLSLSHS